MEYYILYLKKCPGIKNPKDFKIGKAKIATVRSRLASYQNAVGPVYLEEFMHFWIGEDIDVNNAEEEVKKYFKSKISSAEAGLSEWICNIDKQEILNFIEELKNEYFIKLEDSPKEFPTLTMNNCQDFSEWFEETWLN